MTNKQNLIIMSQWFSPACIMISKQRNSTAKVYICQSYVKQMWQHFSETWYVTTTANKISYTARRNNVKLHIATLSIMFCILPCTGLYAQRHILQKTKYKSLVLIDQMTNKSSIKTDNS